jgi:phage anti-repressor protein/GGDEF domain-containing protein
MFHIENWKSSIRDTLVLAPIIGVLAYFFPDSMGFSSIYYLPHLVIVLLLSSIHGPISALSFLVPLFFLSYGIENLMRLIIDNSAQGIPAYFDQIFNQGAISIPLGILVSFMAGTVSSQQRISNKNTLKRLRNSVQSSWRNKRKSEALESVNLELERRVSAQEDSITLLHSQLAKFESANFRKGLNSLLETIHLFSGMDKASIWEYKDDEQQLVRIAEYGWDENEEFNRISITDSIEGWVYRNARIFSLKMALEFDNLQKMERGHNILTYPITLGRKTWGVLNIESLPFERYSTYTESVIDIIIQLASSGLNSALENETLFSTAEIDEITELPLYSQYYTVLEKEVEQTNREGGGLSSVVFEISNAAKLFEEFKKDSIKSLLLQLKDILDAIVMGRVQYFHYKTDIQIALIVPNLDFDGASLFALETLGMINGEKWEIDGKEVPLEFIVGYSAIKGGKSQAAQIISQIDSLLEMQKI